MTAREKTVSVTEFKAHCLGLMDDVNARKIVRLKVEKRGKPHVVIQAPPRAKAAARSLLGSLKGAVVVPADLDLTKPVFEGEVDAAKGRLHR
jgi:hypothetical protein